MKKSLLTIALITLNLFTKAQTVTNNTSCDILVEAYCILKNDCNGLPPNWGPLPPGGAVLGATTSLTLAPGGSATLPAGICPSGPGMPATDIIYRLRLVDNIDCDDYWLGWFGTASCLSSIYMGSHIYNTWGFGVYPTICPCLGDHFEIYAENYMPGGDIVVKQAP